VGHAGQLRLPVVLRHGHVLAGPSLQAVVDLSQVIAPCLKTAVSSHTLPRLLNFLRDLFLFFIDLLRSSEALFQQFFPILLDQLLFALAGRVDLLSPFQVLPEKLV
jgi:hypothetical protein